MRAASFVVLVLFALSSAPSFVLCQPLSSCIHFVPQGGESDYDISWWYSREPSRLKLSGWSWTFSLCSPLPTACPALNAIHQEYSCNWPGSAGICQQWYYDGKPRRICNAASSLPPTSIKAYHSGSNDYGFVMRLEPNAIVRMICDPTKEPEFLINNDVGANFTIRHCSACATDDAKWCGPQYPIYNANMFATIAKDNESPSYLSLNQLPGEMTASEPVPSTFRLSGLFQTSPRAIISFLISGSLSNGSIAHAKISFPAPDTAVLTVTDYQTNRQYQCESSKSNLEKLNLFCSIPLVGSVSFYGSIEAA